MRSALLAIAVLLGAPATLLAHAHLTKSTPAAEARLPASPDAVTIWFSEAPELAFTRIQLLGPDSTPVALGPVARVPGQPLGVKVAIATPLGPGRYTVVWQTAAADGHPTRGRFSFDVQSPPVAAVTGRMPGSMPGPMPAMTSAPAQHAQMMQRHLQGQPHLLGGAEEDDLGAESVGYVAVRWLSFIALLALVGVVAFRWLVLARALRVADTHARGPALRELRSALVRRAAGAGVLAGAALLVAALVRLYVQSYAMHGAADAMNMGMMGEMVTRTTWGTAWLIQAAAALVALVAFVTALAAGGAAAWAIATAAVLVLAFTPGLGGHAAASPRLASLAILLDGLHVLGAGGWLGALLVLATVAIPLVLAKDSPARGGLVADLVNAFSPAALGFAGLVVLTGLFAAWLHLGNLGALWSSAYGRTLLIKLAVLVPVLGTGAYNWLRVRPVLGDAAAAGRLRRSAAVELAIGLVVIGVTAVLVALQPPA